MVRNILNEILVEQLSTAEILARTSPQEMAEVVAVLRGHRPTDEICAELLNTLGKVPIRDFNLVRAVYVRNCSDEA